MVRASYWATCCLAAAAGCVYHAPIDGEPLENVISGEVLFDDGDVSDAIVLAFAATNPGPPTGTGSPVALDTIPALSFGGEPDGVRSGPFTLTLVDDGDYLLSGLMDMDHNFDPFVTALAGSTCGDWAGPLTEDLGAGLPDVVSVAGGELKDGVTLVLGSQIPQQRPAFDLLEDELVLDDILTGSAAPLARVRSTAVAGTFAEGLSLELGPACADAGGCAVDDAVCACADPASVGCDTAIWLLGKDVDLDGEIDPHPTAPGRLDVWPRVYAEYIGPGLEAFKVGDVELRERWVTEAFPVGLQIAQASEGSTPTAAYTAVTGAPPGLPLPTRTLSITFQPVFTHIHADGADGVSPTGPYDIVIAAPGDHGGVPAGDWSLTLVSFTGQTWKLPNELGGLGDATQAGTLHLE